MEKIRQKINNDIIFQIAIALLPFENFFFAPSSGWATITPIIFALYLLLNFKLLLNEVKKHKNIVIFFIIGMMLSIINYFFVGIHIKNLINSLITLGLGFVSLFSFDIYYTKNKDINKIIKILLVSYTISLFFGILQYITIQFQIKALHEFFDFILKRNYVQYWRTQYFFTEPSFIGMHVFGILLPIYFISKNKKILILITTFCITAFLFAGGIKIFIDTCAVGIILFVRYLIKNKKYKYIIIIPIVIIIALTILYNTNERFQDILSKGIYGDGSLATRYFRIQSTVLGYTKKPANLLWGYGLGNSVIPLQDGYDEAILSYKSDYMDEVGGMNDPNLVDDSLSYCLYTRFITEFGLILFVIAMIYILKITKNSTFKYKYSYLLIILYLYLQFESYAFYSIWIYILVMLYTKKNENTNNKRILIGYIENGRTSGIDKYLLNFLEAVDTKKYKIDFLTKNYDAQMDWFLKKKNCKLYKISHNRNPIKQYNEMRKIIQNGKYGVAYFNISETFNCIGILAAKTMGIDKIVVHSHSSGSEKNTKLKRMIANILNLLCKTIVHFCSNVKIACSKNAAKWMYFSDVVERNKYITIYNSVNEKKFIENKEIRNKIKKKHKLENKFVIGHVGRFSYQKNHELLLKIFKKVVEKREDAVLICVGNGENFERIKQYAKELGISKKVIFTGEINNVNEYMQAFDIFVLPSRFEGLPIVGIEAQMAGLPCLFSKNISDEVIISKSAKLLDMTNEIIWVEEICKTKERKNQLLEVAEKYKIQNQKEQFENIINV